MSYYAEQGWHDLPLDARPLSTGALDIGGKLKGWGAAAAILGVAVLTMKYLAPSGKPKRRKRKR